MHLMVDLETLDTASSAVILSIGAALFDPYDPDASMDVKYWTLDVQDQINAGRTVSASTIKWWMQQSKEAQDVFNAPQNSPAACMMEFNDFANHAQGVWGNGSDFDNAILASANITYGLTGWRYSRNRCFRTLKSLSLPREYVAPLRAGTHHNALDDAIYQAQCLQAIVKALGIVL